MPNGEEAVEWLLNNKAFFIILPMNNSKCLYTFLSTLHRPKPDVLDTSSIGGHRIVDPGWTLDSACSSKSLILNDENRNFQKILPICTEDRHFCCILSLATK